MKSLLQQVPLFWLAGHSQPAKTKVHWQQQRCLSLTRVSTLRPLKSAVLGSPPMPNGASHRSAVGIFYPEGWKKSSSQFVSESGLNIPPQSIIFGLMYVAHSLKKAELDFRFKLRFGKNNGEK